MENIEEIFNEILACDVKEALKYSKDGFKESGNPEFLIYTAHCYLVQGFYEEAIAAVDLAFEYIRRDEEGNVANTFLIELDIREGFYEDAINKCVDYIENFECDGKQLSDLKCIIGWTYLLNLNNKDIAKEAFLEAIEDYSNCPRAYTGLGIYEANNKNFNEAIKYFEKAIELNEEDGENYFALAICNKEINNFDVVEEYLVKANALEPEDNRIIEEYAFELLRQGREKEAIEYFKEIIRENPNNDEIKRLILELEKHQNS